MKEAATVRQTGRISRWIIAAVFTVVLVAADQITKVLAAEKLSGGYINLIPGVFRLEYLENRDGVLRAKTEIFDHVRENGHILLNGNDDKLRTVHDVKGRSLLFFGVSSEEEGTEELSAGSKVTYPPEELRGRCVCASDIRPLGFDGSLCRMDTPEGSFELKVPVPGIHNISNAAAATAVGLTYGLSFEQIREGIAAMQTISGRFRILHTPAMTVIDDCYMSRFSAIWENSGKMRLHCTGR